MYVFNCFFYVINAIDKLSWKNFSDSFSLLFIKNFQMLITLRGVGDYASYIYYHAQFYYSSYSNFYLVIIIFLHKMYFKYYIESYLHQLKLSFLEKKISRLKYFKNPGEIFWTEDKLCSLSHSLFFILMFTNVYSREIINFFSNNI